MPIGSAQQPCAVSPVEVTVASVVRTDVVGIATRRPHAYAWAAVGSSSHMRFNPRKRCNKTHLAGLLTYSSSSSGHRAFPFGRAKQWRCGCLSARGAHSNGLVQEFHLIPFSPPSPFDLGSTKCTAKVTLFAHQSPQNSPKITLCCIVMFGFTLF